MMRKVRIENNGSTAFINGDDVDIQCFNKVNKKALRDGLKVASSRPILQGITRASLQTNSFLSAVSFQETIRVLTEASVSAKADYLRGIKENVIIGRLIPAGTGFHANNSRNIKVTNTT